MGGIGCISGACEWFNVGCNGGGDVCTTGGGPYGGGNGYVTPYSMACSVDGTAVGPGMDVHIPGADTLPPEARTWNIGNKSKMGDWTKFMPWRAPGSVASRDPCGVGAGHTIASSGRRAPGAPTGNGSSLPALANNHTTWKAGATAEVAFGLYVNHGGGYQYREPLARHCCAEQAEFLTAERLWAMLQACARRGRPRRRSASAPTRCPSPTRPPPSDTTTTPDRQYPPTRRPFNRSSQIFPQRSLLGQ